MPLRQRTKENSQVFRERLLTAKKLCQKFYLYQCQSQSYFHITTINIFTKYIYACVLSLFGRDQLSVILWTILQALLSMGFSRKTTGWLPCPPPGDLPSLGIKPASLLSPALVGGFFTTSTPGSPVCVCVCVIKQKQENWLKDPICRQDVSSF